MHNTKWPQSGSAGIGVETSDARTAGAPESVGTVRFDWNVAPGSNGLACVVVFLFLECVLCEWGSVITCSNRNSTEWKKKKKSSQTNTYSHKDSLVLMIKENPIESDRIR